MTLTADALDRSNLILGPIVGILSITGALAQLTRRARVRRLAQWVKDAADGEDGPRAETLLQV